MSSHPAGTIARGRAIERASRTPDTAPAPQVVRVGLLGYGRIGQAVAARAIRDRHALLGAGVDVRCLVALVRDRAKLRSGPALSLTTDPITLFHHPVDVIVEVLGGVEPAAALVSRALGLGIPVITANKSMLAACGPALARTAARCGTALACDAAVVAGVPFLGALARRPLIAGVRRIEGILNGTTQFIVAALEAGVPYREALADAVDRGFAEPDSTADTSGRDAAEKLTILLRLAGAAGLRADSVPCRGIDALTPEDLDAAVRTGGVIRPVALASFEVGSTGAWAGPAFVDRAHPLAGIVGAENALRLIGADGRAVTFAGPGAGPEATAATILDDLVELVNGQCAGVSFERRAAAIETSGLATPPVCRWFLSLDRAASDEPESWLAALGVPVDRTARSASRVGVLTRPVPWSEAQRWAGGRTPGSSSGRQPLAIPALEAVSPGRPPGSGVQ